MALLEEWNEQIATTEAQRGLGEEYGDGDGGAPLFTLEPRADFLSQGRGYAVAFAACNDSLFVATSRCFIIRHDVTGSVSELELSKLPESRVRRMFVDPLGLNTLVSLQVKGTLETLYIDHTWKKARSISKLKGTVLTSVAWPPTTRATSEILVGTDKGTLLLLTVDEATQRDTVTKMITLPGPLGVVAGLAQVPLMSPSLGEDRLIIVLHGMRLHFFRGRGPLTSLFASYDPSSLQCKEVRTFDLPIEQGAAQLQLLSPPTDSPTAMATPGAPPFRFPLPTDFAILSTSGVYYGRLNLDASISDELDHLEAHKLLPATMLLGTSPPLPSSPPFPADRPLSIALTQHHFVLLYPSKLQFVNRVSKCVVQEARLEEFASPLRGANALPLGLCRDFIAGRVVVLAGDDALEVDATEEDRDMWKVLLERGDYRAALPYCHDARQRNVVYLAEADAQLGEDNVLEAAELYGRYTGTSPSFEELALRLMARSNPKALQTFLAARLGTLGPSDKAQSTMVATWLLELLLDEANRAALGRRGDAAPEMVAAADAADAKVERFLEEQGPRVLDVKTTHELLEGYGRTSDLLVYARARGDSEMMLKCYIRMGMAERALAVLRKPSTPVEFVYQYAPSLVSIAPAQTVASWVEAMPPLDPRRLVPALLHLTEPGSPPAARAEAMRYVKYATEQLGSNDSSLHNFAVALLSIDPQDEHALIEYLDVFGRDAVGRPLYDPVAALRVAQDRGLHKASILLLMEVGLATDAVQVALEVGGAREGEVVARKVGTKDADLARKLWLAVIEHYLKVNGMARTNGMADREVEEDEQQQQQQQKINGLSKPQKESSVVQEVTRLMEASHGVVSIEDVLPLFPDFVEIDAFREAVCSSLEKYNEEMENLREEMTTASKTAEELRKVVEGAHARVNDSMASLSAECASCQRSLSQDPPVGAGPRGGALPRSYYFPTSFNAFHTSCLCAEVCKLVPEPQRKRINELTTRLASLQPPTDPMAVEPLIKQLENEVAVEDPFCGEIMVRQLTKPLFEPGEVDIDIMP